MEDCKKYRNFEQNEYKTKISEILGELGDLDHMHPGRVVNWKEETVQIDNYSLNRVVNVN